MSTDTSMTIRMDSKLKKEAESICQDMGITFSAAIMIFTKRMVKEKGIPFKLTADPFYSEENIKKLEAAARRMNEGRYVKRETSGEFDEYILSDLVKEGYIGEDLVNEFKVRRKKIRPAVEKIIEEADKAAQGRGKAYTLKEVFGVTHDK